jgi:uncharacterized protein HemX
MRKLNTTNLISIGVAIVSIAIAAYSAVSNLQQSNAINTNNVQVLFKQDDLINKKIETIENQMRVDKEQQEQANNRLEDQMNTGFSQIRDQINQVMLAVKGGVPSTQLP